MSWDTPRESTIENYLVRKARAFGAICYKFTAPGRRSVPDRLIVLAGGQVLFVEVKRPGGKLTPLQVMEHEKLINQGCKVFTVTTKEEADELLMREAL